MDIFALIQTLAQTATVASKQADKLSAETALDVAYHIKTASGYTCHGHKVTYLENGNVILSKGKEWHYYADVEYL